MNSHRRLPRVAVVERFRLVSHALVNVLSSSFDPHPVPVQSLHSLGEVRRAILRHPPDVVLLGPDLGASVDRVELVEALVASGCTVIARADGARERARLLWAGVTAVLGTGEGVEAVREAITRAVGAAPPEQPPPALGPSEPGRMLVRRLGSLSRREVEVLARLVEGRSAAEIARDHVVSLRTVRTQIKGILRKLEVESQLAAVAVARRAAWEPPYVEAA